MKAIVAVTKSWAIGCNNELLFKIPGDLKFFRHETMGKKVIMGRKTLETMPGGRALDGRDNIILSRNSDFHAPDCIVFSKLEVMLKHIRAFRSDDLYVIGGEQIYKLLLPYCSEAIVTHIEAEAEADRYFPKLTEMPEWEFVNKGETKTEDGISYYVTEYRNKNVHPSMKGL